MLLFRRDGEGGYALLLESEDGPEWVPAAGGLCRTFRQSDLLEGKIYKAHNHQDVLKIAGVLVESLDHGWIDRDGNFWGCSFHNHDRLAGVLFGMKDERDAEDAGWVRIHGKVWQCAGHPNAAQKQTLLNIGRSADDVGYRDRQISFADAYPHGFPLGLLPGNRFSLCRPEKEAIFHLS